MMMTDDEDEGEEEEEDDDDDIDGDGSYTKRFEEWQGRYVWTYVTHPPSI